MTGPVPLSLILLYLQDAVQTEISDYVRSGGGRDFRREEIQDAALAWLRLQPQRGDDERARINARYAGKMAGERDYWRQRALAAQLRSPARRDEKLAHLMAALVAARDALGNIGFARNTAAADLQAMARTAKGDAESALNSFRAAGEMDR
jgi:membrane protease subunit (stomatin/prohibitin family)